MVLTLYGMDASSPVRAVKMVINKLNIPDIEYIQINLLKGEHTYDSFLEVNIIVKILLHQKIITFFFSLFDLNNIIHVTLYNIFYYLV